jgi:hypothetical protein
MTIASEKVTLHVVRKGDIQGGALPGWNDPHKLAGFTPQKREALLSNPLSRNDDEPVQVLGLRGDTVIGKIDLISGELLVNNQPLPMFWTSAYYVPEEFRNTMVGVMIVMKMQQLHHTIGACGVSQMALPIFQKLKWLDFTQPRFMLVRRSRAVVERYVGAGFRGLVATKAVDTGLVLHRAAIRGLTAVLANGLRVQPDQPDAVIALPASQPVVVHRSRGWLNWLLANSFDRDPTLRKGLYFIRDTAGNLLGYFLLKMRHFESASHRGFKNVNMATLQDWMSFDFARLSAEQIALLAVRQLAPWNPDAIEICTDNAGLQRFLRRIGFLRLGELHTLIRAAKPSPLAGQYTDQKDWRLRPADGDNFFM